MKVCRIKICVKYKTYSNLIELAMKALKEEQNHEFDPSLRKLPSKSLLHYHVSKPILKVG